MHLEWIKKIGFKAKHNAFVDLCEFNGDFYCCYREAKNHVSGDGNICILSLNQQGDILTTNRIQIGQTDLRDPKLSISPKGQLLLIAYARKNDQNNRTTVRENLSWFSTDGKSWSSSKPFGDRGWWLWRLTWHNHQAFGFGYNKRQHAIHLYSGDPRRSFHQHKPYALGLQSHQKGYPNESDILFFENQAYALVRRDADTFSAQLGHSKFPFKNWRWTDLGRYIGGPAMLKLDKHFALVAGRIVKKSKLVTALLKLNLYTGQLQELLILPSKGDNSYPGLIMKNQHLWVSYYSSHQDNKSCIYLAKIALNCLF